MSYNDSKPLKALVLCAGHGTRLKPLTEVLPKPLATILDVPLVDLAINRCVEAGVTDVAINTHHLANKMGDHVQARHHQLGVSSLHVSHETPHILGTGGALSQVADWWGDSLLLVYNGDILSNISFEQLISAHRKSKGIVTMAVTRTPPAQGRSVWVNSAGFVKAICEKKDLPPSLKVDDLRECGFACAYVAGPELRSYLPKKPEFFDVIVAFQKALTDGHQISVTFHEDIWADVGTPLALWQTNLDIAHLGEARRKSLFGTLASLQDSSIGHEFQVDQISVVSRSAIVGRGARISQSVILPNAAVAAGEVVDRSLLGPNFKIKF